MEEEEYAAIHAILLFKAVGWGEGFLPGTGCDMCFCLLDDVKVGQLCSIGGRVVVIRVLVRVVVAISYHEVPMSFPTDGNKE